MTRHAVTHRLFALSIIAALSQQTAHAEAFSSARIGPYQYTLIDLDPNDGIDASITFGQGQVSERLSVNLSDGVGYGGGPNSIAQSGPQSILGAPAKQPQSLTYQGFKVTSGADGLVTSAQVPIGAQWAQTAVLSTDFVLSAHTAVTFTAQANSVNRVVVPAGSVVTSPNGYINNGYFDWAPIQSSSAAMLYIGENPESAFSSQLSWCGSTCVGLDSLNTGLRSYATTEEVRNKLLSLTFSNTTASVLGNKLSSAAYANGYATAPLSLAVPEPSSSLLMLVGLTGMGGVLGLRRRQTRR